MIFWVRCDDIQTLFQLKDELINMLNLDGFDLHKWGLNSDQFIKTIPNAKRESLTVHQSEGTEMLLKLSKECYGTHKQTC